MTTHNVTVIQGNTRTQEKVEGNNKLLIIEKFKGIRGSFIQIGKKFIVTLENGGTKLIIFHPSH